MFYKISNTFLGAIDKISVKCEDSEVIKSAMKHIMTTTIVKGKYLCRMDLFKSLIYRKLGTAEINELSSRLCDKLSSSKRNSMRVQVMKWKYEDTYNEMKKKRHEEKVSWRDCQKLLSKANVNLFNEAWATEKYLAMKQFRSDKDKKIKWLRYKYLKQGSVPDEYEGVCVKDQQLDNTFNSVPKVYGSINISPSVTAA